MRLCFVFKDVLYLRKYNLKSIDISCLSKLTITADNSIFFYSLKYTLKTYLNNKRYV